MVTKLLHNTNLTPPRRLVVSQATTKGIFAPIPYGLSTGADTLTLDGYLTGLMVLQGKPTPLTPGRTPVLGRQVNSLKTTIVTYVL